MNTERCFCIAIAITVVLQFCGCQLPAASVFANKEPADQSSEDPLVGFPASLLVKDVEKFMTSRGYDCTWHFDETLHYRPDTILPCGSNTNDSSDGRSTPTRSTVEHCTYLKCTLTTRSGLVPSWLALMFVFDPASGKITNQARDWSGTD